MFIPNTPGHSEVHAARGLLSDYREVSGDNNRRASHNQPSSLCGEIYFPVLLIVAVIVGRVAETILIPQFHFDLAVDAVGKWGSGEVPPSGPTQ